MRASNQFIMREIAGEYLLVPVGAAASKFNGLITMNEIGNFIFQTLQTEQTEETLVDAILGEYEIDRETAQNDLREFLQQMADIEDLKAGKITIGGAASFNISYLPKTVAEFAQRYSGIDIEIVDGNIPEITNKALNGQVDIFIAPTIDLDDRLKYEELLQEKIFLCVPPQWKINDSLAKYEISSKEIMSGVYEKGSDKIVDFAVFKECPFILLKKDQHIGHTMDRLFKKHGFEPKKSVTAEQTMTSYGLTLAGVGISLMTESTIKNSNFKVSPKFYMADPIICSRKIYAVYSKQKYLSKAARIFITILKKNLG